MKKLLLLVPVLAAVIGSCTYTKQTDLTPSGVTCADSAVSYAKVVQPILTQSCALSGCHDAATASDGYDFTSYTSAKLAASNSQLLGTINHTAGYEEMPQGTSKLPDCKISQIASWVADGALNN